LFHKKQIGNLLDGRKWVADTTTPEVVPKAVNKRFLMRVIL
jgi:hypothetical protein